MKLKNEVEYVYHVDNKDNVIGKVSKEDALEKGILHRGVGVVVTNSKGQILIHRRSKKKRIYPGCYDFTFGGWAQYGETYEEAGLRELKEETGIKGKIKIKFLYKGKYFDDYAPYFIQMYYVRYDGKFKFQKNEVEWAEFADISYVIKLMKSKKVSPDTNILFNDFNKRFLNKIIPKQESISIVNKKDKVIGKGNFYDVHPKGKIFRAVRIFIKNSNDEYLLLKRTKTMKVYPRCWEIGVAGTVKYKESYDSTARRELKEELNITSGKLKKLQKVWVDDNVENLFCNTYLLIYDGKIKKQDNEISTVKYVHSSQIDKFAKENKMHLSCWKYFKMIRKSRKL